MKRAGERSGDLGLTLRPPTEAVMTDPTPILLYAALAVGVHSRRLWTLLRGRR
jgi:hypothetical protein